MTEKHSEENKSKNSMSRSSGGRTEDWQEKAKVVKESNKQTDKATMSSREEPSKTDRNPPEQQT